MTAGSSPDVFIAEPVGSCTDLKATVDYPLRRLYGDDYQVAPLSVLIDPVRGLRILGLEQGTSFSSKVAYIYGKQLEEADLLVINKIDLLSGERLQTLRDGACGAVSKCARSSPFLPATKSGSMIGWRRFSAARQKPAGAMDVDYQVYADGEALLGWLNCGARLSSESRNRWECSRDRIG